MEPATLPAGALHGLALPRGGECGRNQDGVEKMDALAGEHQGDVVLQVFDDGECAVWNLGQKLAGQGEAVAEDARRETQPVAPAGADNIESTEGKRGQAAADLFCRTIHLISGLNGV